jgi:hypothetical protein
VRRVNAFQPKYYTRTKTKAPRRNFRHLAKPMKSSETLKNAVNMMTNDELGAMISPKKLLPAVQR